MGYYNLNPIKFKKELSVDFLEEYKLKQSRCPNNSRKKIYKKIVNSKDRRIKRDYLKNFEFDKDNLNKSFESEDNEGYSITKTRSMKI